MKYIKLTFNLLYFIFFLKKSQKKGGILKSDSEIKHYFIFCPRALQLLKPKASPLLMYIHLCVL